MVTVLAVAVTAVLVLPGCGPTHSDSAKTAQEKTLYTCGMHPQVIQDKPGNCPICGMKLTPMRKQSPGDSTQAVTAVDASVIEVDPVTTQNMGIRTALVTRGPLRRIIRTVGTIDYSESAQSEVTTKFKGWIEKLYVDATGLQVHRGEPLFEIYSPKLYSAQTEYLLALQGGTNSPGTAALKASALTKLKFFDISDEQIAELEHTRQAQKALRIAAPQDGFVVDKMVVEGQMVDPGMKLYRLADLAMVWVQAQIYEQDLAFIKLGQEATVTLSYLPDREFRGRVTYIYPNVDEKTRTARVRMEFHNPGYFLKPGMFATVQLSSELAPSVLLVPDMAVLRSGEKSTVFVALDHGKFQPRMITLGQRAENDSYEVVSGLQEGERIVTSGQFMLDSESQLREAIQKMTEPKQATGGVPEVASKLTPHTGTGEAAPHTGAVQPGTPKYICPMPEHVSIEYDHPGKCPICNMTLVPVTAETLRKLNPGGKLLYYTCPMPEHSDVHENKPGKCPRCGMTLVPVMEAPPLQTVATNQLSSAKEASTTLYTCPMASDADVVSDKPGKCPKCEMDLVPTSTVPHRKIAEANWQKRQAGAPSHGTAAPQQHQH